MKMARLNDLGMGYLLALALTPAGQGWSIEAVECGRQFVTFPATVEDDEYRAIQGELTRWKLLKQQRQEELEAEGYPIVTVTKEMIEVLLKTGEEATALYDRLSAHDKKAIDLVMMELKVTELEKTKPTVGAVTVAKDEIRRVVMDDEFVRVLTNHGVFRTWATYRDDIVRCLD